ncbi:GIY-YIG nuclease family protein [Neobacillus drentensis]|uniref:GIY-YIG nuclease family protein n=2 Tax=Neobacillus drentensis TaxID=220684 RepID=UPI001F393B6A|nr:GIY-YIG nuclease family protein [Neobacillus drentensis]
MLTDDEDWAPFLFVIKYTENGGIRMELKEKVKNLPSSPGVYLMKDSRAQIIYVGKAKNLKNRVRSYFQNSQSHSQKIIKLKASLKDFDYILTDTEFEAFMLECQLIREIKPIFNRMMKSPQAYIYIGIQMDDSYQRIEICSTPDKPNNLYFGPYTSKHTVERALQGIKNFYKISCSTPSKKNNPCLNYSLGLCIGVCMGGTALDQYNDSINKIIGLLEGKDTSLLEIFERRMIEASETFEFEEAVKYRDMLESIHSLLNKEKVIEFAESDKNLVVIESLTDRIFKLFLIKKNNVLFSKKYQWSEVETLREAIKTTVLTTFKTKNETSAKKINKDEIDAAQIIYSYLKGSNSRYLIISEQMLDLEYTTDLDAELMKLLTYRETNS